jgi:uncharacterized integral membrane protein
MMRNIWIYRRLLALAVLLGITLSFVVSNREKVKVTFPFLGEIDSTSGILMLASAALGAAVCWLVMTFRQALHEARDRKAETEHSAPSHGGESGRGTETEARKSDGPPGAGP